MVVTNVPDNATVVGVPGHIVAYHDPGDDTVLKLPDPEWDTIQRLEQRLHELEERIAQMEGELKKRGAARVKSPQQPLRRTPGEAVQHPHRQERGVLAGPGPVKMYVCGVTPYDESHLGHAMSYIIFDVVRRYLEYRGYQVSHVQNFTDIDDKIIARANRAGHTDQGAGRTATSPSTSTTWTA